ncbi:MAG: hypothetical protein IJI03_02115, partial [Rudaea sp.]|nr:hypothetical protein [Rudaea sp.]
MLRALLHFLLLLSTLLELLLLHFTLLLRALLHFLLLLGALLHLLLLHFTLLLRALLHLLLLLGALLHFLLLLRTLLLHIALLLRSLLHLLLLLSALLRFLLLALLEFLLLLGALLNLALLRLLTLLIDFLLTALLHFLLLLGALLHIDLGRTLDRRGAILRRLPLLHLHRGAVVLLRLALDRYRAVLRRVVALAGIVVAAQRTLLGTVVRRVRIHVAARRQAALLFRLRVAARRYGNAAALDWITLRLLAALRLIIRRATVVVDRSARIDAAVVGAGAGVVVALAHIDRTTVRLSRTARLDRRCDRARWRTVARDHVHVRTRGHRGALRRFAVADHGRSRAQLRDRQCTAGIALQGILTLRERSH